MAANLVFYQLLLVALVCVSYSMPFGLARALAFDQLSSHRAHPDRNARASPNPLPVCSTNRCVPPVNRPQHPVTRHRGRRRR